MNGMTDGSYVNYYIAIALIAGLIAVLAFSFYYEIQLSAGQPNKDVAVPIVTVTATKIVIVTAVNSTSCNSTFTNSSSSC
jgi:hypothetical protein